MEDAETEPVAGDMADMDLALLGFDDIRDLAREAGIVTTNLKRPALVHEVRLHGIGVRRTCASLGMAEALTTLTRTVADLASQMAVFMSLREEVSTLREEIQSVKRVQRPTTSVHDADQLDADHDADQHDADRDADQLPALVDESGNVHPNNVEGEFPPLQSLSSAPVGRPINKQKPGKQNYSRVVMYESNNRTTGSNNGSKPFNKPDHALRTHVSSYYQRPPKAQGKLKGGTRTLCHALYLGHLDRGSSASSIVRWCAERDVPVVKCSVSESRFFGLAFAHVVIRKSDLELVSGEKFWPPDVRVRDWRFNSDRIATSNIGAAGVSSVDASSAHT